MSKSIKRIFGFILPFAAVSLPFAVAALITNNIFLRCTAIAISLLAIYIYAKGLHREDFDPDSSVQKSVFAFLLVIFILLSFFICAVSIESEWLHNYPLEKKVDDYGCYPQMFDAFQKGQLNIDTEYDLSILERLENPYNTAERREATGEKYGPTWDRAYYNGKLYSYFGIAPVVFLYYPAYFLTGRVLSDALAAAVMTAVSAIFMALIIRKLCERMNKKPPFLLMLSVAFALPCGALLWSTETCANFYHLAVLSGISAICGAFYHILKADESAGAWRKLHFAFAGICVAATVASRPNLVIYIFIALPLLLSIIKNRPFGVKSLLCDIAAFCVPMISLGILIMLYNNARFGSPFDFGANYQLTLTDTSTYSLSGALFLPSLYHFFIQPPHIDGAFPYLHPVTRRFAEYSVERMVYTDRSVGSLFFPITWGVAFIPALWREHKRGFITAIITFLCTVFLAFFDLCYGGVHLRYSADIMFILALLGGYLLLYSVGKTKKGGALRKILYTFVAVLCILTVITELPLIFDNERDMIMKYHKYFYDFIKS
ncbi:MAG: hypothetical protein J6Q72_07590 [Clostridia bacterium]|nr:hypothetical protein [Clostridia bacterium]